MPLTILVRSAPDAGAEPPSLTFDGTRIVIGRGSGCDVRLPDPSVSHRHASVRVLSGSRAQGAEYSIIDEDSTNGTYVGGERLPPRTPHTLKSGDLVRVGRVWLELRMDQGPATRDVAGATRDLALALVVGGDAKPGDEIAPRLVVVEGHDARKTLELVEEGRAYVIGRGEDCDLVLRDPDASREHVAVVRRGATALLRDLGSKNGADLGGEPLAADRDVAWPAAAILRIGATALAFEEPVAQALAELEHEADEAIRPEDVPPQPAPRPRRRRCKPPRGRRRRRGALPGDSRRSTPSACRRGAGTWTPTDIAVIAMSIVVIALSAAVLFWVLRADAHFGAKTLRAAAGPTTSGGANSPPTLTSWPPAAGAPLWRDGPARRRCSGSEIRILPPRTLPS